MSWKHVDRAELNQFDIFAFVNLKQNVVMKGRVFTGSDLVTKVLVMDSEGEIQGVLDLPDWAYYSTEDAMLKAFYEEVGALPGGDFKNKVWNMTHNNYRMEQLSAMIQRLTDIAFETPEAIILKYVPDLTITDSMLEQFKF
ncbi:hypothetical protein ENKO_462 [Klebsiella phage fENko-Kae01]|uniref:hypothetical protein n=1 Tax=Salmonella enterica TaxID=28901 RepID=UPI000FDFA041|nr:hypothetical protein CPT_Munch_482 [Salmonella phage Munch]ECC6867605.1 hypothetical protein [Salmonella enterica]ECV9083887.1 hypothetical protein [Salmonella enterica subsp. enterica serovar Infantis]MCP0435516.1 hypothetical protein [Salmonella enterica subsp. enterica serovar Mbandaka]WNV47565.1 hypothetical protein [Klebsiella phage fENko-Kae01]